MAQKPASKKSDPTLLSSVKLRKKTLEKDAAVLRKQINTLTASLYELQNKITLLDKLIEAEAPKKRKPATKAPEQGTLPIPSGRTPAAVKKN